MLKCSRCDVPMRHDGCPLCDHYRKRTVEPVSRKTVKRQQRSVAVATNEQLLSEAAKLLAKPIMR